jgi:flagellar hook-length control protein FliK
MQVSSGPARPDALAAAAPPRLNAYPPALSQLALPQLAFEIARQVQGGNDRFRIRLDPPELGRIDVRLDFDAPGGAVHARLAVERAETLDLLQRDQRALERALAQAGLDSERTSLEFSLRQNGSGQRDGGEASPFADARANRDVHASDAGPEPVITLYRGAATPGGVDRLA